MNSPIDATYADACHVCQIHIPNFARAITREEMGKIYPFCSEKCLKKYLEDPELYSDFGEEEALE